MLAETNMSEKISGATTEPNVKQPKELTQPATSMAKYLRFSSVSLSSHLHKIKISIDVTLTALIIEQTKMLFHQEVVAGLDQKNPPDGYLDEMYQTEIINKVKNYLFYHVVIDFLINEIFTRKILMTNYPRLTSVEMFDDKQINYHFDISIADHIELKEWKHFAFKPPKRKKYKDLDKQVISFIDAKLAHSPKKGSPVLIEEGDWVLFDVDLINNQSKPVSHHFKNAFWLHIDQQEISELQGSC